jgi:DNA-binding NtrC family response regulator
MVKLAKKEVLKALKSTKTQSEAAEMLGVSRRALFSKRKELGLHVAAPRGYNV